ncbi:hypothetical protein BH23ACT10_BH23ACT10_20720 [soil metagenome]
MPEDNRKVPIKIDGQTYVLDGASHVVSDLLKLAGLDPEGYDLFRRTDDTSVPLDDGDRITVEANDRFIVKRQSAPVA